MAKGTRIVGEQALLRRLERLGRQSTVNKVCRPALREASGEIRKLAKFYAQSSADSGLLRKSIKNVVRTARGSKNVYAVVGPAHGFRQWNPKRLRYDNPVNYAHLVELGTSHSRPKPFLRPAYDSVDSERIMSARIWKELKKEAAKK